MESLNRLFLIAACLLYAANAACPNHCNGHGTCDKFARCGLDGWNFWLMYLIVVSVSGVRVMPHIKERIVQNAPAHSEWLGLT
jgi:hypothetical protein